MKKILSLIKLKKVWVSLVVVLVLIGFFTFKAQAAKTPQLQFAEVKKQDIQSTVSASGVLTGKNTTNLKFKSPGKLAYINVKVGDNVKAGQVIAGLDTQDLSITLQQAQNTLRDKQALAQKAEDDAKDHASDESFTLKATRTTAQAARDSAFDNVKAAQRAFQDAVLIAPIDGTVTQAIEVTSQNVFTSDVIAQIVDTTAIYFDIEVDEADISHVFLNEGARITLDAYPNVVISGSVDQILPQTRKTTSGATVIPVRIKIDSYPQDFVNGLSGEASLIISIAPEALTIPLEALKEDNTVQVSENNKLIYKKVVTGISSDTDVEIKQGLNEGEQVVLNPK